MCQRAPNRCPNFPIPIAKTNQENTLRAPSGCPIFLKNSNEKAKTEMSLQAPSGCPIFSSHPEDLANSSEKSPQPESCKQLQRSNQESVTNELTPGTEAHLVEVRPLAAGGSVESKASSVNIYGVSPEFRKFGVRARPKNLFKSSGLLLQRSIWPRQMLSKSRLLQTPSR